MAGTGVRAVEQDTTIQAYVTQALLRELNSKRE